MVEIPNSVTSIGNGAFCECYHLTSIEIPNSVTSIGEMAFTSCTSLKNITSQIPADKLFVPGSAAFGGIDKTNCTLYVPKGAKATYAATDGWKDFTNIVELEPEYDGKCGDNVYYKFDEVNGKLSIFGDGAMYDYASYYENPSPWHDSKLVKSVEIKNGVTTIGDKAFDCCTSLTSIEIPYSVTSIGKGAFYKCTGLTGITIPNSITNIEDYAFNGCNSLKEVHIEDGITTLKLGYNTIFDVFVDALGRGLFYDCPLEKLYIGRNLSYEAEYNYGYSPFSYIRTLSSITIGNNVTSIGNYAFNNCSGLTSIEIPNNVTSIGESAFFSCSGLTSIEIPNSVTSIGNKAFYACYHLTSIEIPNSVTSIGLGTFRSCFGLKSIKFPNSVTSIGDNAFDGCSGLTSIEIPNSVTSIGQSAFSSCSSLASIKIDENNTVYDSRNNCNAIIETASNTLIAGCKNTVIPNSVLAIGEYAFHGCSLTSIEIPNSVRSIGNRAFIWCTQLTSIEIPKSVISIGDGALMACGGLTSIEIPNSVENIGSGTFGYCGLTSIEIPSSVTSIGEIAFYQCNKLTSIVVDDNNTIYDSRDNCNAIIETSTNKLITGCKNTVIPDNIITIGQNAFYNCYNLTSIQIPSSVKSIEENAFGSCRSLTEITSLVPADKLFVPGNSAFNGIDKSNCTLYVPKGAKATYSATDGWKDFTNIVEIKATYNVTFIINDSIFATDSIVEGDKIIYPEVPEKEGHTFSWDTIIDIMPSNDITITGKYVTNSYLLTYKVDGEVYASDSIKYGETIEPIEAPTKEGHTFSGWSEIPTTMPAKDVVVEGSFTVNSYLLTYKVDGEVYASDSIKYGETIEPIAAPTKEGHTFSGWSEIPTTMPAKDVVVEGSFTVNSYLLTYKVDGEIYASDSIKYGETIEPIAAPTKEGHTFSGWSDIPRTMPAKDVVVEGSFTVNSYLLTYKVDGEIYASDSIKYGETIEPIEEPTKEGHTFSGWSEIPTTMPAKDVIIEGSFTVNSYTVTFMIDGEIYETMTVEYGAEIELPTPPEKEGYIFSGWIDAPATMPAEDIVIEGNYVLDTTGIGVVGIDLENNEVYNLKGQRITETESLTRGIYIVNGKKVFIK